MPSVRILVGINVDKILKEVTNVKKCLLTEQEDENEDVGVGLSTAELEPAIILSESFSFED